MSHDSAEPDAARLAGAILDACRKARVRLATAESCTGGMVAAALTSIPGSSDVFDGGYVTYSNEAKIRMLGVEPAILSTHGAVSKLAAIAMSEGALNRIGHDSGAVIAVTGIAGPGGGTAEKPVGLVHLAAVVRVPGDQMKVAHHELRLGDIGRSQVRAKTVQAGLILLLNVLNDLEPSNHP